MNHYVRKILPAALGLALTACNSGGVSHSTTRSAVAADNSKYLTITSAQDGSKRHIAIPGEPTGDFGDPTSPVDEDVGMQGYADGINAIKALAADAATGTDAGQAFSEIMTQTGLSSGSDGPYAPVRLGSILLAAWYQRDHPGTSFADAAAAVEQSQPDIRKIKKAAHVARLWLSDLAAQRDSGAEKGDTTAGVSTGADATLAPVRHAQALTPCQQLDIALARAQRRPPPYPDQPDLAELTDADRAGLPNVYECSR